LDLLRNRIRNFDFAFVTPGIIANVAKRSGATADIQAKDTKLNPPTPSDAVRKQKKYFKESF